MEAEVIKTIISSSLQILLSLLGSPEVHSVLNTPSRLGKISLLEISAELLFYAYLIIQIIATSPLELKPVFIILLGPWNKYTIGSTEKYLLTRSSLNPLTFLLLTVTYLFNSSLNINFFKSYL